MTTDKTNLQERIDELEYEIQEALWEISNPAVGMDIEKAIAQHKKYFDEYVRISRVLRSA